MGLEVGKGGEKPARLTCLKGSTIHREKAGGFGVTLVVWASPNLPSVFYYEIKSLKNDHNNTAFSHWDIGRMMQDTKKESPSAQGLAH